jgi:hypothetical protein
MTIQVSNRICRLSRRVEYKAEEQDAEDSWSIQMAKRFSTDTFAATIAREWMFVIVSRKRSSRFQNDPFSEPIRASSCGSLNQHPIACSSQRFSEPVAVPRLGSSKP